MPGFPSLEFFGPASVVRIESHAKQNINFYHFCELVVMRIKLVRILSKIRIPGHTMKVLYQVFFPFSASVGLCAVRVNSRCIGNGALIFEWSTSCDKKNCRNFCFSILLFDHSCVKSRLFKYSFPLRKNLALSVKKCFSRVMKFHVNIRVKYFLYLEFMHGICFQWTKIHTKRFYSSAIQLFLYLIDIAMIYQNLFH